MPKNKTKVAASDLNVNASSIATTATTTAKGATSKIATAKRKLRAEEHEDTPSPVKAIKIGSGQSVKPLIKPMVLSDDPIEPTPDPSKPIGPILPPIDPTPGTVTQRRPAPMPRPRQDPPEPEDTEIMDRVSTTIDVQDMGRILDIRESLRWKVRKEDEMGTTSVLLTTESAATVIPKKAYTSRMTIKENRASEFSKGFGFIDNINSQEFFSAKNYPKTSTVGGFSTPTGSTCQVTMTLCDPNVNLTSTSAFANAEREKDSKLFVRIPGSDVFSYPLGTAGELFFGKTLTFAFVAEDEDQTFLFWIEEESDQTVSKNPLSATIYANYK